MFEQEKLTYLFDTLEPVIDAETMEIHYTKHHAGYVSKLNDAVRGHEDLEDRTIEELLGMIDSVPGEIKEAVRNNGGGHANHSLFWEIMTPRGSTSKKMEDVLSDTFGSFDEFKELFSSKATGRFGSGWAWLVRDGDDLEVYSTPNQDSPLMDGKVPLLGLDVWEHAYYLKYQNKRAEYVEKWWDVVNWEEVERRYENG